MQPSLSAHKILWTEIYHCTGFWFTATNCSEQTVALYWGFDSIFCIDYAVHCSI